MAPNSPGLLDMTHTLCLQKVSRLSFVGRACYCTYDANQCGGGDSSYRGGDVVWFRWQLDV